MHVPTMRMRVGPFHRLALLIAGLALFRSANATLTELFWTGCGDRQCATLAFCEIPGAGYGYR